MMLEEVTKKNVNFKSCFDIIGPIMIGPSSSHTAGAIGIGCLAHKLFQGKPDKAVVKYYESFAETHKGHGTDYAIASGILGFATDDIRVPAALDILKEEKIAIEFIEMKSKSPVGHPNTACITLTNDQEAIHVTGISVGGGLIEAKEIEVSGFQLRPQGNLPILLVLSPKEQGFNETIEKILVEEKITINHQERFEHADYVLQQYDLDTTITHQVREQIKHHSKDSRVILL